MGLDSCNAFSDRSITKAESCPYLSLLLGGLAFALCSPLAGAEAAEAGEEVFAVIRPSLVAVEVANAGGKLIARGSGVVIASGEVATGCGLIDKRVSIRVQSSGKAFKAVLRHERRDLDVCRLDVPDLNAPAAIPGSVRNLKTKERVYAAGLSWGQTPQPAFTAAEISSRRPYAGSWYTRISAPELSPDYQGGGLFNGEGQLVGILSLQRIDGQNLVFALPVDWVRSAEKDTEKQTTSASMAKKAGDLKWLNRSFALEKKGDWAALLKLSRQQIVREPRSAAAWFNIGAASTHLNRYREAVHAYREAIRHQAGYSDAWRGLGIAYAQLKEYEPAIQALRNAVHFHADNAEAWYALGKTYHEVEQYPQAIHAYRESLRFEPENADVWYSLAKTYDELKLNEDALEAYRKTVHIQPKNVEALYRLGVDYAVGEQRTEMRETYRKLRELDPAKADLYFNTYILP